METIETVYYRDPAKANLTPVYDSRGQTPFPHLDQQGKHKRWKDESVKVYDNGMMAVPALKVYSDEKQHLMVAHQRPDTGVIPHTIGDLTPREMEEMINGYMGVREHAFANGSEIVFGGGNGYRYASVPENMHFVVTTHSTPNWEVLTPDDVEARRKGMKKALTDNKPGQRIADRMLEQVCKVDGGIVSASRSHSDSAGAAHFVLDPRVSTSEIAVFLLDIFHRGAAGLQEERIDEDKRCLAASVVSTKDVTKVVVMAGVQEDPKARPQGGTVEANRLIIGTNFQELSEDDNQQYLDNCRTMADWFQQGLES